MIIYLKKQKTFSTNLIIKKIIPTTKGLALLRDKYLEFDFRYCIPLRELFRDIYYKKFTIEEAEKSAR